jgi:hypothetical protein
VGPERKPWCPDNKVPVFYHYISETLSEQLNNLSILTYREAQKMVPKLNDLEDSKLF